ncbi:uncharacterized protein KZ484_019100 [Pholidichthys leucotaenia]
MDRRRSSSDSSVVTLTYASNDADEGADRQLAPPAEGIERAQPSSNTAVRAEARHSHPAGTTVMVCTNAVTVQLPDFWREDPASWFLQAEAQFILAGITADDTKFYHIVSKLDFATSRCVRSLIRQPPARDKYETLKATIVANYVPPAEERAERILVVYGHRGGNPKALMEDLLQLKEEDNDNFLFQFIFLSTLPPHMRGTLANTKCNTHQDFRTLASEAYWLVNACKERTPTAASADLRTDAPSHGEPQPTEQTQPTVTAARPKRNKQIDVCYYHHHFAEKAHKCVPPCKFTMLGKRQSRGPLTAAVLGEKNKLLYVTDGHTGKQFLIDTGAQLSFIMPSHADRAMGTRGNGAVAANGSDIDTFGEKSLHLLIHGRSYRWTFVVAALESLHHLCRPASPRQEVSLSNSSPNFQHSQPQNFQPL